MSDYANHGSPTHGQRSRLSGMALTSMILGIAGLPLVLCFGAGGLLGLIGLILGIVSLISINKSPGQFSGKGFAITGIVTGGVSLLGVPLALAIMLPAMGKARELSNRALCAANLRGTVQSMNVYAADHAGDFPVISRTGGYGLAADGWVSPGPTENGTLEAMRAKSTPSVTQNMWVLVLTGQVLPQQFLCKSDPAPQVTAMSSGGGGYFTNFNDGTGPSDFAYSYSFAYPWTESGSVGGWWKSETDGSLPLMGDMAPQAGTGSPAANPADFMNKVSNSFTHQRDGQNIGFGDAHAEFMRRPDTGQRDDNFYTGNQGKPGQAGTQTPGRVPPIGDGGSPGMWDICLVPAADGITHARK